LNDNYESAETPSYLKKFLPVGGGMILGGAIVYMSGASNSQLNIKDAA